MCKSADSPFCNMISCSVGIAKLADSANRIFFEFPNALGSCIMSIKQDDLGDSSR